MRGGLGDCVAQSRKSVFELVVTDDEGWQQLDRRVPRTAGLNDQATLKSALCDAHRSLGGANVEATQQTIASNDELSFT
jgi:hypothetical protein